MTTKTIYIADDGKEFEDEKDCFDYEQSKVNSSFMSGELTLWNIHKDKVYSLDDASFASVKTEQAAETLKEMAFNEGCECPCYDSQFDKLCTGEFYYDRFAWGWKNANKVYNLAAKLHSVFG